MEAIMRSPKDIFLSCPSRIYCFADTVKMCRTLLEAGARIIQLRNKTADDTAFKQIAREMKSLKQQYEDTVLIINDRVDIAVEIDADGIHVGQKDEDFKEVVKRVPGGMIVGVSTRFPQLAAAAEETGATYVGTGAVFPTPTKPDAPDIGIEGLRAVIETVSIPVVAIGGITAQNVQAVCRAGARYAAIISDINGAPDPGEAFKTLDELTRSR
jgi:thiamine-phosphate pyrophosphorylase